MAMYLALFSKGIVAAISAAITLFSTLMANVNRNYRVSQKLINLNKFVALIRNLKRSACYLPLSKNNVLFQLSDMTTRVFSLVVLLFGLFVFVCMWSGVSY